MEHRGFHPDDIAAYIELRGVYDGWSVAHMKDGRMLNRWPPGDPRHEPTQHAIDRMEREAGGRDE